MYRIERHNLDGTGSKPTRVYDVPAHETGYWPAVTDTPCPCCQTGTIRWAEAGYVPGYRICDQCKRHFVAGGNRNRPSLLLVGNRR